MSDRGREPRYTGSEIAIVGMACRFPGASDVETFWRNLCAGVESLTELSDDDLRRAGVEPELLRDPAYVRRVPVVEGIELFDAGFFGYAPLEARLMDPQHRLFLECAWEAFEQAGYVPSEIPDPVGVFTGAKTPTYLFNLVGNGEIRRGLDTFQLALGNDLGAMATRVSHRFDLRGPSVALHTACSTSLVAVHLACQSLLLGECRMALAGGAAVNVPQNRGYLYREGGILSPDGSCRAFDAAARGSSFGNGAGAVLLKRLEDARAEGDTVWAVIRGTAVNNDGASRASFTAPGVDGQTAVVLEAQAAAEVDADSIGYVEAHGTGTALGDPIEVMALTEAFRASSDRAGFCRLGSVKSNLGHLETAAGVAGLIKTALALRHGRIPPSLHFERPNPGIDFESSPFRVATELADWPAGPGPRRAGVSSFGIGSTNAHAVLEEPPPPAETTSSRPVQLLTLSARSRDALDTLSLGLAAHLEAARGRGEAPDLADVAFTLHVGRKGFDHRRTVVCRDLDGAVAALGGGAGGRPGRVLDHLRGPSRKVAFLLPGIGDQVPGMGRELYRREPAFREAFDLCAGAIDPVLGIDLRGAVFGGEGAAETEGAAGPGGPDLRRMLGRSGGSASEPSPLDATELAQPAVFALEYALARLLAEWGVRPAALLGHSLGEYAAACLAGVLRPEDAARLVAERTRLVRRLPSGAMLAVPLPEAELAPLLAAHGPSLAAVNTPSLSVAAGAPEAVEALERELTERGVVYRRMRAEHAFHSAAMEPAAEELARLVAGFELRPPEVPLLSNVTGTWAGDEVTDPAYWARHACRPVRFADGVAALLAAGPWTLVEVGPGQGLASFVRQHPDCDDDAARHVLACLEGRPGEDAQESLVAALGRLWLTGQPVDWPGFHRHERRRRVPLPTYPFERERHWVEPDDRAALAEAPPAETADEGPGGLGVTLGERQDLQDWFYRPVWRPLPPVASDGGGGGRRCLLLDAGDALGEAVAAALRETGWEVARAAPGASFAGPVGDAGEGRLTLDPERPEDYGRLLEAVAGRAGGEPDAVLHLWSAGPAPAGEAERFAAAQRLGFYSLLHLAQAVARRRRTGPARLRVAVATRGVHALPGDDPAGLRPEAATVLGPVRVIPQELPGVECRAIDLPPSADEAPEALRGLAGRLVAELTEAGEETVLAYREGERRHQVLEPAPLPPPAGSPGPLREAGVYLIAGGTGGLGLALAGHLARTAGAKLVLTGSTPLPPREEWESYLARAGAGSEEGDRVAGKLRNLLELEAAGAGRGAEVLAVTADAADPEAVRGALAAARERFGALHGVFHLAGVPGGGILHLKTREAAERVLAPKAVGALVLDRLLREAPPAERPDFLVLFSSIASVLGEFGQIDYCGANALLDALAERNAADPDAVPTRVIDWDIWREVGLAVEAEVPEHLRPWREEMLARAIAPAEGVAALDRLLAADGPRWVVSTQELAGRIELGRSLTGEGFLEHLERGAASGAPAPPARRGGRVLGTPFAAAGTATEREIAGVWERVLGVERVGVDDNFFELGGNSLLGLQLVSELNRELGLDLAPVDLFDAPSVGALARRVRPAAAATAVGGAAAGAPVRPEKDVLAERRRRLVRGPAETADRDVAIVGMAGRFPGARSVEALWANLAGGVESVTVFSDEELLAAGVPPELLADPEYVRAGAILDDVDLFDAALFGYSPREAEVMDPQHRIFLECAWEALERAGYDPSAYPGAIGVFAGSNLSTYLLRLHADREVRGSVNMLQAILGNDRDSLTTAVSYKLGLRGPSVAVQTFCSTSLVATHMAVRSLRSGECDMALAGGIRVVVPTRQGYLYERGGLSPADGRSRPFDAAADGSVLGNGVGIVVLKRLADALEDGDLVHAVIKGSAVNNDGSLKAGYTAPSVEGQSEAVALAYEDAGVDPRTVGYLEAHGSATALGDPIEVAALTRAFRRWTGDAGFCALGSIKSNFGHLDRAAGVAGLIKAALALEREEIPPTLHFERPNPEIDFAASPFRVAAERTAWPRNGDRPGGGNGPNGSAAAPRRAGVSSLGMGGTNVHVVLEEAPAREPSGPSRDHQLLVLSARSEAALERASLNLAERLVEHLADHPEAAPEASLADAAFTLKVGRKTLEHRRFVVSRNAAEAVAALRGDGPGRVFTGYREAGLREVAYLLPGIGAHEPGMARGLYDSEPAFRDALDRCAALLEPRLGLDLRELIYPAAGDGEEEPAAPGNGGPDLRRMVGRGGAPDGPASPLDRTRYSQPALFAVEYALAELWREWGVRPAALLGYSLGEYVAACLAGVLSLEDALVLVAERARLVDELPEGALLAVGLPEERLRPLLGDGLSLMAVNGPEQTVASGPETAIAALEAALAEEGAACRRLPATHPFHSAHLEPAAGPLTEVARELELRPPRVPYLSNVTGDWIRDEEATDPAYWARHLVAPVRFSEGLAALAGGAEDRVLLEVGPGRTLTSLVLQHPEVSGPERAADAVASLGSPYESRSDQAAVLEALGRLWLLGVAPDWRGFYARERRRRTVLPTYPFERRRYWIETSAEAGLGTPARARPAEDAEPSPAEAPGGNGHGARPALGSYPRPGLRTEYAPPRSPTERRICELWQDLLGVERVGVHDSFLELGGDSLLATRLIARMRDAFELELPLRVFFERSTVAELAEALEELREQRGAAPGGEEGGDAELLARIRGMSEEELDRELARLEGAGGAE